LLTLHTTSTCFSSYQPSFRLLFDKLPWKKSLPYLTFGEDAC